MGDTPALSAAVVLDGHRYEIDEHLEDGTTRLVPADDSHDRVTVVRTAELEHEDALSVWTLPGRLLARDRATTVTVTTEG